MCWPSICEYFSVTLDKIRRLNALMILGRKITHEAPATNKPKHQEIVKATELPKLAGTLTANISQRQRPCVCVLIPFVTAKDYHQTLSWFLWGSGVSHSCLLCVYEMTVSLGKNLIRLVFFQNKQHLVHVICCSHMMRDTFKVRVKCNPFFLCDGFFGAWPNASLLLSKINQ